MTPETVLDIFRDALFMIMLMVAVVVVPSLIVGLIVSVFQAATQINEQTMSFLPRLMVTLFTIIAAGPWMMKMLLEYTTGLITDIPMLVG